uniref:Uncharacterized protein n=1 Tax=Arundo donax TaxID=35708 RepID=A0A0A9GI25_ARUDO
MKSIQSVGFRSNLLLYSIGYTISHTVIPKKCINSANLLIPGISFPFRKKISTAWSILIISITSVSRSLDASVLNLVIQFIFGLMSNCITLSHVHILRVKVFPRSPKFLGTPLLHI